MKLKHIAPTGVAGQAVDPPVQWRDRSKITSASRAAMHARRFCLRAILAVALVSVFTAGPVQAGGGPENYFLVVNSASANSLAIANHYIALRNIPSSNVLYIAWKGDLHTIDVETFRKQILQPIVQTVHERDLTAHIDGIVYSSDFPYKIDFKGDLAARDLAALKPDAGLTPVGSLNSLTFYYHFVLSKQPWFLNWQLATNGYFRPIEVGKQLAETHGFRGWYGWGNKGELLESGGQRYLMSTMLGLTVPNANTAEEVVSYLARSAKADGSAPSGTIYFASSDDPRSKARAEWFEPAVSALKELGVNAQIVPTPAASGVPTNKNDIAGLVLGTPSFNLAASESTILPGAICENLTSFGAEPTQKFQTLLTDFLKAGAAGSCGTPVEPMLIVNKFPHPYIQVHYARGCTLAEAFYQSVAAPYQLVIVGDPLCRPWAKIPQINLPGIKDGATLSGKVSIEPTAVGGGAEVDRFEIYLDGALVGRSAKEEEFELDTSQYSDGVHELRVVGIESGPIATQGRSVLNVRFDNHGRTMTFAASVGRAVLGQRIKLQAKSPGAQRIIFYSAGRELGSVSGASASVTVDTVTLGAGPVTLRAIALGREGAESHVLAAPITIRIDPKR